MGCNSNEESKPYWSVLNQSIPGPKLLGRGVSLMKTGEVFIVGGASYSPLEYTNYTQIYDPNLMMYKKIKSIPSRRYNAQAETLPSGKVLVFGGFGSGTYYRDAFIYDADTDTWTSAQSLPIQVQAHTSTVLLDGNIITFGGHNGQYLDQALLYIESTDEWLTMKSLPIPLFYAASTLLPDGTVLIVGGRSQVGYSAATIIYNPSTDTYQSVENAPVAMRGGFLETMSNGDVIYGGGEISPELYSANAYHFSSATNTWGLVEQTPDSRAYGDSVTLEDGTILVFGGNADQSSQSGTVLKYGY